MPRRREIVAVRHSTHAALFDDGTSGVITNWIDAELEVHTAPIPNPVSCVVKHEDGTWCAVDVSDFEPRLIH